MTLAVLSAPTPLKTGFLLERGLRNSTLRFVYFKRFDLFTIVLAEFVFHGTIISFRLLRSLEP